VLVGKHIVERMHESRSLWNSGLPVWGLTDRAPILPCETGVSILFITPRQCIWAQCWQARRAREDYVVFSYDDGNSYMNRVSSHVGSDEIPII